MNAKKLALLVLDAYGGSISGKTLLQKVCYFVDIALDLHIGFWPHHYGPYSPTVEEALGKLKGLGFIKEDSIGFGVANPSGFGELRRFDYHLSKDGRAVVQDLKNQKPEECEPVLRIVRSIRECGDPDYFELSIAAKTHFILKKQGKPMTPAEIKNEAARFDWTLSPEAINKAFGLLAHLNLVQIE